MSRSDPTYEFEHKLYEAGFFHVAGADEAGRGALAGPLVAAAVILAKDPPILGLNDSKVLSSKIRLNLSEQIKKSAISYAIVRVSKNRIDEAGVHLANLDALSLALTGLHIEPDYCLIDGYEPRGVEKPFLTLKRGDSKSVSIAAASILAKVERDQIMLDLHDRHPEYGFDRHKGYCTKDHLDKLNRYGPLKEIHRFSFSPVSMAQKKIMGRRVD
ncbi:MAG: ribonuclease HII [Actinomycetota bacterium]|nr:ribonuclease HII [Actinomycetota bacterium]